MFLSCVDMLVFSTLFLQSALRGVEGLKQRRQLRSRIESADKMHLGPRDKLAVAVMVEKSC
jgi:hypothetical protein